MTKYSASLFVCMAVVLSILNTHAARQGSRRLEQELNRQANTALPVPKSLPAPNPMSQTTPPASNATLQIAPVTTATNLLQTAPPAAAPANPTAPATNAGAAPAR